MNHISLPKPISAEAYQVRHLARQRPIEDKFHNSSSRLSWSTWRASLSKRSDRARLISVGKVHFVPVYKFTWSGLLLGFAVSNARRRENFDLNLGTGGRLLLLALLFHQSSARIASCATPRLRLCVRGRTGREGGRRELIGANIAAVPACAWPHQRAGAQRARTVPHRERQVCASVCVPSSGRAIKTKAPRFGAKSNSLRPPGHLSPSLPRGPGRLVARSGALNSARSGWGGAHARLHELSPGGFGETLLKNHTSGRLNGSKAGRFSPIGGGSSGAKEMASRRKTLRARAHHKCATFCLSSSC